MKRSHQRKHDNAQRKDREVRASGIIQRRQYHQHRHSQKPRRTHSPKRCSHASHIRKAEDPGTLTTSKPAAHAPQHSHPLPPAHPGGKTSTHTLQASLQHATGDNERERAS
jgi:hypothetical protein